ncbi:hypothetical protein KIPB_000242 [Kipferlia bialata]|uniref:Uncharacterized protein n=1 Tax=Kipferlia bialata TaxID=797122 RepID=A0A9K3CQ75_9EUKA|nr:hypothetical protein KIPB_000242 [Kipferlia bialata]|eukprot:g242.t1
MLPLVMDEEGNGAWAYAALMLTGHFVGSKLLAVARSVSAVEKPQERESFSGVIGNLTITFITILRYGLAFKDPEDPMPLPYFRHHYEYIWLWLAYGGIVISVFLSVLTRYLLLPYVNNARVRLGLVHSAIMVHGLTSLFTLYGIIGACAHPASFAGLWAIPVLMAICSRVSHCGSLGLPASPTAVLRSTSMMVFMMSSLALLVAIRCSETEGLFLGEGSPPLWRYLGHTYQHWEFRGTSLLDVYNFFNGDIFFIEMVVFLSVVWLFIEAQESQYQKRSYQATLARVEEQMAGAKLYTHLHYASASHKASIRRRRSPLAAAAPKAKAAYRLPLPATTVSGTILRAATGSSQIPSPEPSPRGVIERLRRKGSGMLSRSLPPVLSVPTLAEREGEGEERTPGP